MNDPIELNTQERLDLNRLLQDSQAEDRTDAIRRTKASGPLLECVRSLEKLKQANRGLDGDALGELCRQSCAYYYNNYTDIFNRQLRNELNLGIMIRFIRILELIEQGLVNQHEGSVMIGKYLKELYVDSALRRADHLDDEHKTEPKREALHPAMSWRDYKQQEKI